MGQEHLIDSNVIIDFFNGSLPEAGRKFLSAIKPVISIITQIEIFGSKHITPEEYDKLKRFIDIATIYPIDEGVALATIDLRLQYSIKLPDALIAATAIHYDLKLVTRNVSDFKLKNLDIINPYKI
ncbi:type II toxin-antitoxin system VapC family toxin [Mucilaginibacter sp. McL0603]|uniref:type II toxin-antitoxin system VapC family toxin n=1 Tax=Mucilaginibacter sp. McL0603 TaxID=3415670 RepID=UPI003CF210E3